MDELDRLLENAGMGHRYDFVVKDLTAAKVTTERMIAQFESDIPSLRKHGHNASAASVINIIANLQQNLELLEAAIADAGKDYTPPGGWKE